MPSQPPESPGPFVWGPPLLFATVLDAPAFVGLVSGRFRLSTTAVVSAIVLHLLATAVAGFPTVVPRSQRGLMAAFAFALPFIGPFVAMLTVATPRRGVITQAAPAEAAEPAPLTLADIHRLTNALSASESLMSGSPDERSATVAMLARHPDAVSIALLRRAVKSGDGDLAVEAALALEDLGAHLDACAAAVHADLEGEPDFDRALADADALSEAIHSGLPDPSSLLRFVDDARRCYERAAELRPDRLPEMASRWARLEMDALRPEAGLAILDRASAVGSDDRLVALRAEIAKTTALPPPRAQSKTAG